jgi:hypothetical protein
VVAEEMVPVPEGRTTGGTWPAGRAPERTHDR